MSYLQVQFVVKTMQIIHDATFITDHTQKTKDCAMESNERFSNVMRVM